LIFSDIYPDKRFSAVLLFVVDMKTELIMDGICTTECGWVNQQVETE
jgi:hypothetical protein